MSSLFLWCTVWVSSDNYWGFVPGVSGSVMHNGRLRRSYNIHIMGIFLKRMPHMNCRALPFKIMVMLVSHVEAELKILCEVESDNNELIARSTLASSASKRNILMLCKR